MSWLLCSKHYLRLRVLRNLPFLMTKVFTCSSHPFTDWIKANLRILSCLPFGSRLISRHIKNCIVNFVNHSSVSTWLHILFAKKALIRSQVLNFQASYRFINFCLTQVKLKEAVYIIFSPNDMSHIVFRAPSC